MTKACQQFLRHFSNDFEGLHYAIDRAYLNADHAQYGSETWHHWMDIARELHELARQCCNARMLLYLERRMSPKPTQLTADALFRPLALDQRVVAESEWQAGLRPTTAQLPCDHGLFGDGHLQLDLVEMLQEQVEDE